MEPQVRLKSRLIDIPRRNVLRLNQRFGRFEHVTWLLGDARSGTTWVSDLINHHKQYRDMFEPVRPAYIDEISFIRAHEYVRPGKEFPELRVALGEILTGRFTHPKIDGTNVRPLYQGMLVKDCFANLLARWACEEFPWVRPVLLIRNPFAVALSKQKKKRPYWPTDPAALAEQAELREDHIGPYVDTLYRTAREGDTLQCMLATWAVINLVPLRQFAPADLHVCFYEDMYADPERQLRALYEFTYPQGNPPKVELHDGIVGRPSRMSGEHSNVVARNSPVTAWEDELSPDQVDRGAALLAEFGLDGLYGRGSEPDHAALERVRRPQGAA